MPVDNVVLEKDPFMEKPENAISGEEVTLSASTGRIFALQYGCFFTENLAIRHKLTGEPLRPLIDFTALHLQQAATAEAGREVVTVIRIDLENFSGDYLVDYHAFGGEYSTNAAVISRLMNENETELETIAWGQIIGKPDQYNPAAHVHDVSMDVYNWNDLVQSLDDIRDAIYNGGLSSVDAVFRYIDTVRDGLINSIAQAIQAHNTASSVHDKSAIGLGFVQNLPMADRDAINANNQNYLNASIFPTALLKAFSNFPLVLSDPRAADQPVQVIRCDLPQVADGKIGTYYNEWILFQGVMGNSVPESIASSTTQRWQMVIGIGHQTVNGVENSNRAMTGVRVGSGTSWSSWLNMGTRMLDKVPNFGAADASPENISPDSTVDDKLVVPTIAAAIARNAVRQSTQEAVQIDGGSSGSWVQSNNLEAGLSYMAAITGFLRAPTSGTNGVVDTVGMAHRVIDPSGGVLGQILVPAGSFLGLPPQSLDIAMTQAARIPVHATVTFTAPSGTNRRVRFGLDVDTSNGSPRGQVTGVALSRLL